MFYPNNSLPMDTRENMRGGNGTVCLQPLAAEKPAKCRLFSRITIPVGGSIGLHRHDGETEMFYFVSGTARCMDDETEIIANPGDTLVTSSGHSHSVENIGSDELNMVAVIILD